MTQSRSRACQRSYSADRTTLPMPKHDSFHVRLKPNRQVNTGQLFTLPNTWNNSLGYATSRRAALRWSQVHCFATCAAQRYTIGSLPGAKRNTQMRIVTRTHIYAVQGISIEVKTRSNGSCSTMHHKKYRRRHADTSTLKHTTRLNRMLVPRLKGQGLVSRFSLDQVQPVLRVKYVTLLPSTTSHYRIPPTG